jgi:hypothetical protein
MTERCATSLLVNSLMVWISALAVAQQPRSNPVTLPVGPGAVTASPSPAASGKAKISTPGPGPTAVPPMAPAGSAAAGRSSNHSTAPSTAKGAVTLAPAEAPAPTPAQAPAPTPAQASAPPLATVVAPKPAPELDQMKVLEGKWRCNGRAPAGPSGPEHAYKSTWKFKRDLDNFWWAAEYQQAKAKANPLPMKARGYLTYDPSTKTFVLVGVDNLGGSSTESTSGWSGDVVTLAGDATVSGSPKKRVPYREVITKKGNREFTWRGEMKMDGDWVTLGEDLCKK